MPDLTPETHIKLSTGRFLGILGAVITFVASVVGAAVWSYANTLSGLRAHVDDHEIHLDRDYMKDHGHPIGRWDLEVERNEEKERLDGMAKEVQAIHNLLIDDLQKRRR